MPLGLNPEHDIMYHPYLTLQIEVVCKKHISLFYYVLVLVVEMIMLTVKKNYPRYTKVSSDPRPHLDPYQLRPCMGLSIIFNVIFFL